MKTTIAIAALLALVCTSADAKDNLSLRKNQDPAPMKGQEAFDLQDHRHLQDTSAKGEGGGYGGSVPLPWTDTPSAKGEGGGYGSWGSSTNGVAYISGIPYLDGDTYACAAACNDGCVGTTPEACVQACSIDFTPGECITECNEGCLGTGAPEACAFVCNIQECLEGCFGTPQQCADECNPTP